MEEIITDMKEIMYKFLREEFIKKFRKSEKNQILTCDLCNENMNNIPNIYYVGDLKEPELSVEKINNDIIIDSGGYAVCEKCSKRISKYGFMKIKIKEMNSFLKRNRLQDEFHIKVDGNIIKLERK